MHPTIMEVNNLITSLSFNQSKAEELLKRVENDIVCIADSYDCGDDAASYDWVCLEHARKNLLILLEREDTDGNK